MILIKAGACPACATSGMVWTPLKRDLAIVLVAKTAALLGLYALFFSPPHHRPAEIRALFETAASLAGARR